MVTLGGKRLSIWPVLLCCLLASVGPLLAQPIAIINPSFEDQPASSRPPQGWFFCGERISSPPDVNPHHAFGVTAPAQHGETYLGLVTRADSTYEAVGQALRDPLQAGQCYRLGVYVRRSLVMQSIVTYPSMQQAYITAPCRLRVRGAVKRCAESSILAVSPPVFSTDWQYLELFLQPATDMPFLLLEAYYGTDSITYGNLQVDQVQLESLVDCVSFPPTLPAVERSASEHPLYQIGTHIRRRPNKAQLATSHISGPRAKTIEVNKGLWKLAQLLQEQPDLKLSVGIRASSGFRFRESKKRWRKAWRPIRKMVDKNRIRFIRIQDTSDFSIWTYRADAAPYWLAWH